MTDRPSVAAFMHEPHSGWKALMENETEYGFGYDMARLDIAADLPALTTEEQAQLWHPAYTEGYLDAYADLSPYRDIDDRHDDGH